MLAPKWVIGHVQDIQCSLQAGKRQMLRSCVAASVGHHPGVPSRAPRRTTQEMWKISRCLSSTLSSYTFPSF